MDSDNNNNYYYNIIKNSGKIIKQSTIDSSLAIKKLTLDGIEKAIDVGSFISKSSKDYGVIAKQYTMDCGGIVKQLTLYGFEKAKDGGSTVLNYTIDKEDMVKQLSLNVIEKVKDGGAALLQNTKEYDEFLSQYTISKDKAKQLTSNGLEKAKDSGQVIVQYANTHKLAVFGGIVLLPLTIYGIPAVVHTVGFSSTGIVKGTFAAQMMSNLVQGSRFVAILQSIGAKSSILHLVNPYGFHFTFMGLNYLSRAKIGESLVYKSKFNKITTI